MRQQPRRHTVGDTTTIVQRVAVPAGALVQPQQPMDTTLATLLGPPTVTREGDSVRIAYRVTLWVPGSNTLTIPGAIVLRLDGRIDTLPDARVPLNVASVLPVGQPAARVAPKQARPWVPRADRTLLPWAIAVPLVLVVALASWWHRRRRGPAAPAAPQVVPPPVDAARLAAWIAAGESRLAVLHLDAALRDRPEAAEWCAAVAALRYAPETDADLHALAESGLSLLGGAAT
jgi:hypothetical protein